MNNTNKRKAFIFIMGGGISVILYFLLIGIYTRISADPIIFFASLFIAGVVILVNGVILWKTGLFDYFTLSMICLVYFMGIIILTVFGPTFIDRSISYHIAFYAVDEQRVDIDGIKQGFSDVIFEKRIHDAIETGFLNEETEGIYTPTWKAELMTAILKPIGEITESLDTYEELKKKVAE